jgi:WD40 repeat protein
MAFTADGRLLACALSRTVISIHSAATGERLATLEHPDPQQVLGLAFSPDGRRLAVASPAHQVRVWDLRQLGAEVRLAGLPWVVDPAP